MNQAQIESFLRIVLAASGPAGAFLLAHGMSAADLNSLSLFLVAGVPLVLSAWGWWSNRQTAQIKRVEDMPGTKQILVDPQKANTTMLSIADDTSRPKVTVAP